METRAILFDKDGTLYDFQATWAPWGREVLRVLSEGDALRAAVLAEALGFDPAAARFRPGATVVAGTAAEVARDLSPHLRPGWTEGGIVAVLDRAAEGIAPAPACDLVPFLGGLRARGLRLATVTNDSERPARAHLARSGIAHLFDVVIGADSGHGGKPSPEPLLAAAAAMGVAPGACVMVGDSRHDLVAGRAAGMRTVGVLTGPADAAALAPLADVVLDGIADLPGWLGV